MSTKNDLGFETEEDIYIYTRKGFEEALVESSDVSKKYEQ